MGEGQFDILLPPSPSCFRVKAYYFNIIFRLKLYFLQYNIQYVYFHIKAQLCKSFYGTFLYVSDIKDSATVS